MIRRDERGDSDPPAGRSGNHRQHEAPGTRSGPRFERTDRGDLRLPVLAVRHRRCNRCACHCRLCLPRTQHAAAASGRPVQHLVVVSANALLGHYFDLVIIGKGRLRSQKNRLLCEIRSYGHLGSLFVRRAANWWHRGLTAAAASKGGPSRTPTPLQEGPILIPEHSLAEEPCLTPLRCDAHPRLHMS